MRLIHVAVRWLLLRNSRILTWLDSIGAPPIAALLPPDAKVVDLGSIHLTEERLYIFHQHERSRSIHQS